MFVASKLLWFLASPDNLLLLLAALGAALLWTRWSRLGRVCVGFALAGLLILAVLPVGQALMRPLEERFPRPVEMPAEVEGIIVLGGYQDLLVFENRGQPELTAAADRLVAFVELARRYPHAKLVVSGGSGMLLRQDLKESDVTRGALACLGFDDSRVIYEEISRTTHENAMASKVLARPSQDGPWLLVTSAGHMPRAMGVFRAQDWRVLPYPVDYRTVAGMAWEFPFQTGQRLALVSAAMREWVGLAVYRLIGRSDALFPAAQSLEP
ncbi:hypothetical protein PCS_02983 [Desulfocurvibacter africanus PCS]|uniref:DUF218 domain-containing protein n=1 Tax=Desulfocurvibacter africanus PCS TaxID=1262666 RepID=M5Q1E5_DESAF|nr:YdcF family protein [Desulfocurvibacter africanus]EMG36478.1 hypothetical protein PCS_02983 [Desulfocurvibacter africanus PCS]